MRSRCASALLQGEHHCLPAGRILILLRCPSRRKQANAIRPAHIDCSLEFFWRFVQKINCGSTRMNQLTHKETRSRLSAKGFAEDGRRRWSRSDCERGIPSIQRLPDRLPGRWGIGAIGTSKPLQNMPDLDDCWEAGPCRAFVIKRTAAFHSGRARRQFGFGGLHVSTTSSRDRTVRL
jgi:hypothetical protein